MAKGHFSLGPGGGFPVSHLQGEGDQVLTWLPFVHPNTQVQTPGFLHVSSGHLSLHAK
jgi:hypothetical protein